MALALHRSVPPQDDLGHPICGRATGCGVKHGDYNLDQPRKRVGASRGQDARCKEAAPLGPPPSRKSITPPSARGADARANPPRGPIRAALSLSLVYPPLRDSLMCDVRGDPLLTTGHRRDHLGAILRDTLDHGRGVCNICRWAPLPGDISATTLQCDHRRNVANTLLPVQGAAQPTAAPPQPGEVDLHVGARGQLACTPLARASHACARFAKSSFYLIVAAAL